MIIPLDDNFQLLPNGEFRVQNWDACTADQKLVFLEALKQTMNEYMEIELREQSDGRN
jgi:hypothetical protein